MHDEKYGNYTDNYLLYLNNVNMTNQTVMLNRLPTLGEILANKTKSPVNIYTFYEFMRDVEGSLEYLDFWFDLVNHLNLCKHYVKGLKDKITRRSEVYSTPTANRNSVPLLEATKHKSLNSSMLLDLIINDHVLEETDSHRLSQFLRGGIDLDTDDPRIRELLNEYNDSTDESSKRNTGDLGSPIHEFEPPSNIPNNGKRISSHSKLLEDQSFSESLMENQIEIEQATHAVNPRYTRLDQFPQKRASSINPSMLEKILQDSPGNSYHSFITRENLKESSHNLLLTYFLDDSEKTLNLPQSMNAYVRNAIEMEGRDDPDIFNHVKDYVFNKIENDHLPRFLNFVAIRNVSRTSLIRIIIGFFFAFVGFWMSFIFIFLNYRKLLRVVIIVPFLIAFYCLVSSVYLIDPILVWFGYCESFSNRSYFLKVEESFIYKLLVKRSMWVLFLILIFTAIFTVLFSLVPGHRL